MSGVLSLGDQGYISERLIYSIHTDINVPLLEERHWMDALPLTRGVPQGSIFGPLLFVVFINDPPLVLSDGDMDIFADDTTFTATTYPGRHISRKSRGRSDNFRRTIAKRLKVQR